MKKIKLSSIKNKTGFLYRVAKVRLDLYGVYFCNIDGVRTEIVK